MVVSDACNLFWKTWDGRKVSIPTFTIYGTEGASRVEWKRQMERESRREGEGWIGRDVWRRDLLHFASRKLKTSNITPRLKTKSPLALLILIRMQQCWTYNLVCLPELVSFSCCFEICVNSRVNAVPLSFHYPTGTSPYQYAYQLILTKTVSVDLGLKR